MNRRELRKLDAHIRSRISELQSCMDARSDSLAAADETAHPERELERKIVANDRLELLKLHANLRWLGSEDGGRCERCGRDIPMERLLAVPVTRCCVTCARDS